jgi:polar amino acid transport system substrate-binding protein
MTAVILISLWLLSYSTFCSADQPQVITVVADDWCPYNCQPNTELEGLGIEFLRAIYEPLGFKIDYQLMPWSDAVKATRAGQYNAVIGAFKSDAEGFVFPENAFAHSHNCFFVKQASRWKFNGISSLHNQKIGVIEGYSYGNNIDEFIRKNKQSHVFMVSDDKPLKTLFHALETDTISAILEDKSVFEYHHQSEFAHIATRQVGCQLPANVYVAFSPAHPDSQKLAEIFDRGFIKLKHSDLYMEILQKYKLR